MKVTLNLPEPWRGWWSSRGHSPRFLVHGAQTCSGLPSPPLPEALRGSLRLISEKPPFLPEVKACMCRACWELLHQRTQCPQGSRRCPLPRPALVQCTCGAEWRTVVTDAQLCQPSSVAMPESSEPACAQGQHSSSVSLIRAAPTPPRFPLVTVVSLPCLSERAQTPVPKLILSPLLFH